MTQTDPANVQGAVDAVVIEPTSADVRQRWARQVLDLPADPETRDPIPQVLQRLESADFVPDAAWRQAMHALVGSAAAPGGTSSPSGRDCLLGHAEEELREQVEDFARGYFQLAPQQRRERWQQLRRHAAASPAIALRLEALGDGLSAQVPAATHPNPDVATLAELATRLFVLPLRERARVRRQRLAEMGYEISRWRRAAQDFDRDCPQLATLAPDIVRVLSDGRATKAPTPIFQAPAFQPVPARAESRKQSSSAWWKILVPVIVAVSLVRIVPTLFDSSRTLPTSPTSTQRIIDQMNADLERMRRQAAEGRPLDSDLTPPFGEDGEARLRKPPALTPQRLRELLETPDEQLTHYDRRLIESHRLKESRERYQRALRDGPAGEAQRLRILREHELSGLSAPPNPAELTERRIQEILKRFERPKATPPPPPEDGGPNLLPRRPP